MSEPLHYEPLYPRLNWNWSWRGITLGHLSAGPLVLGGLWPVCWFLQETVWPGCPSAASGIIAFGVGSFVAIVQFRREPDYLKRQVQRALLPRHLSPFVAAVSERVFPVTSEQL